MVVPMFLATSATSTMPLKLTFAMGIKPISLTFSKTTTALDRLVNTWVCQLKIRPLHPFLQVAFQISFMEVVAFPVSYQLSPITLKLLIRSPSNMSYSFFLKHRGWLCLLSITLTLVGTEFLRPGLFMQLFACHSRAGVGCDLSHALGPRTPNDDPVGFYFLILCFL